MEENNQNVNEREIDLRVIFSVLRKNILPLILSTVIVAAAALAITAFFIPKQYRADAMLIVNTTDESTSLNINSGQITAAQDLAEVYSIIIKSDTVIQQVIDDLKLSVTYEALSNQISVSSVNSTQVISVSMTSTDADYAKKVIEKIVEVAPPIIADKVDAGSVKVISEATIANNGNPVSPSLSRNTIIGAVAGLVLMLAIVFIKELLNNTFKTENDISNQLQIPLLGIIPEIDEKEFNK